MESTPAKNVIRQFVAMPLGQGYTVEAGNHRRRRHFN
jgi:hypothetical protein